ncbi:MAG: hypothetical protein ACKVP4_04475 [Hyphomicrobium sp.]
MAKGQNRQGREVRKPKKDPKVKAAELAARGTVAATFAAPKSGKK